MKKPRIYRAKGDRWSREKAQLIGERLASMGSVTPSSVVEDARDPKSPLHECFDWDDGIAAEKWRLAQARNVINCIITYEPSKQGEDLEVRAFYHVMHPAEVEPSDSEEEEIVVRYAQIDEVQQSADFRAQVIAQAKAELNGWRQRWKAYADVFGAVFRSIDEFDKGEAG